MTDVTDPWIGRRFGRYELRRRVGGGGGGTVFAAWDDQLEREVALKVLHETAGMMGDALARFRQEAVLTARLNHPNIVPIYDVGEDQGSAFITMRLLPGRTLGDLMDERGTLPQAIAVRLGLELGEALAYAHGRGIVHRDLKPANVLFDEEGRPMLVDFGIAKALDAAKEGRGMTEVGTAIGTPAYMSPEQAAGQPIDARSDIYSLGLLLYQMVTGRTPFVGTAPQIMQAHLYETPTPPSQLRADLNPEIEALILKALAKDPAARFAGMAELVTALRAVQRGEPTGLRPMPTGVPRPQTNVPTPSVAPAPTNPASAPTRIIGQRAEVPPPYTPTVPPPSQPYAPAPSPYATVPQPYGSAPSPYGAGGGYPPSGGYAEPRRGGFPFWSVLLFFLVTLCSLGALTVGAAYGGYLPIGTPPAGGSPVAVGGTPTLSTIGEGIPTATPSLTPTGTLQPSETPTETLTPTETPTPTVTPTEIPTEIPTETPVPTETPAPTATPACTVTPAPAFEGFWDRDTMGCVLEPPTTTNGSYEPFERGFMVYDASRDIILVFSDNGKWQLFPNEWEDGDPEFACKEAGELGRPARGFGMVWCANGNVRGQLGDPLAGETTLDLTFQKIEFGEFMINIPARPVRVAIFSDGTYVAD